MPLKEKNAQRIIGILGGMGPEATSYLFQKIIEKTPARTDQDHLRVIIDSNPKIPSRQAAIEGRGESPVPAMLTSGRALVEAGVHFIVIPCVTAHYFLPQLHSELAMPILSILEETAIHVSRNHPQLRSVGLLATRAIISTSLFQEAFLRKSVNSVLPDKENQRLVQEAISEIKSRKSAEHRDRIKRTLVDVAGRLIDQGAQGIVAGCTEIPIVLQKEDLPVPLFNVLDILAEAAVLNVLGER